VLVLARPAPEVPDGQARQPERDAHGGDTDHPNRAILRRERRERDANEKDREHEEERAQRTTLRSRHGGDSSAEKPVYTPWWNL
jgi:hypothetical protein